METFNSAQYKLRLFLISTRAGDPDPYEPQPQPYPLLTLTLNPNPNLYSPQP